MKHPPVLSADDGALEFIANRQTGTVHVSAGPCEPPESARGLFDAGYVGLLEAMLCGTKLRTGAGYAELYAYLLDTFEDDALCARCVRALGDQSARAFEHPRPGDEEYGDE